MLTTKKFLIFASTNNDKYLACRLVSFSADVMSIEQKTTKPLAFPVVLWHYRLSGRKDIRLIKIQWLFQ